ncbi:MAG: GNAT family N-acetyltransferase [Nocardioidaceae bacterium]
MSRAAVSLRDATLADAPRLVELWCDVLRRCDAGEQETDLAAVIAAATNDADTRIVVAELDGVVGGAVLLKVASMSPLNLEPIVQVIAPHVFPDYRRHGLGRALMDAAATFAEQRGIAHIGSGSLTASRDGNRFLARLGLGPHAVLRVGSTQTVRAKLEVQRASRSRAGGRQIGTVLAARRAQRRRQTTVGDLQG